jgi:hypothetical protein
MLQQAVYDLTVAPPHEPADARFTAAEFALYREGYEHALLMAMKTMKHAVARFELRERTKRLAAKRRREK